MSWRIAMLFALSVGAASAATEDDGSLVSFDPGMLEHWNRVVASDDEESREVLAEGGVRIVLPIVDAIDSVPRGRRRHALEYLDEVVHDAPRALQRITSGLRARLATDRPQWRRRAAAVVLRRNARLDERLATLARSLTTDRDPVVRACSITSLAALSESVAGTQSDRAALFAALEDPSRHVRSAVLDALWVVPELEAHEIEEVVTALWRLFDTADADIRSDVFGWLARVGPKHRSSRARFEALLDSPDESTRRFAVKALLRYGSLDPALRRRLGATVEARGRGVSGREFRGKSDYFARLFDAGIDPVTWVRREHPDDVDWLVDVGAYALRNLEHGEPTYEILLDAMELEHGGCTSGRAVALLRGLPSEFLSMVEPRLDHADGTVRVRALEVVAASRPPSAAAARLLADRLMSESKYERARALDGLVRLGSHARDTLPALRSFYDSTLVEDRDRVKVVEAIVALDSEESRDWLRAELARAELPPSIASIALRGVIAEGDGSAYRAVIDGVLDSGSQGAAQDVCRMLAASPDLARGVVADRLSDLAGDTERLETALEFGFGDVILAARPPARDVVPLLAPRLRDERGLLDWNILDILAGFGEDAVDAVPYLVDAFETGADEDTDGMERASLAAALASVRPEEGIARLEQLIDSPDPAIDREYLVDGLLATGRPEAIEPLLRLFEHDDPVVSESAAHALLSMRADPHSLLPRIVDAIDHGVYELPFELVERIGAYGPEARFVAPWLLEGIRTESIPRVSGAVAAAEVLAGTGRVPEIFEALLEGDGGEDVGERAWLLYARARIGGSEEYLPHELEELLEVSTTDLHGTIIDVLERLGPLEASASLLERMAAERTHPYRDAATMLLEAHRVELERAPR